MSARAVILLCAVWLVGCAMETPPPVTLSINTLQAQGWVLWEGSRLKGHPETWRIQDAHEQYQDCEASRRASVDAAATTAEVVQRAGHIVILKQSSGEEFVRYLCLPATIDPRK
jgi:hypothetical protein